MSQLEIIDALPASGDADHAALRTTITKRTAYTLAASETLQTINVVDPADGTIPLYVIYRGFLFEYDSTDATTVHDGFTCLVSQDGKRYKVDSLIVASGEYPFNPASDAETIAGTITDKPTVPHGVKAAIDSAIAAIRDGVSASFDTLAEIATALGLKAPLASPIFTGIPEVPTAATGTNTTQAASTAFVQSTAVSKAIATTIVFG